LAIARTFSADSLCAAGGTFESVTGTGVSELVAAARVEVRVLPACELAACVLSVCAAAAGVDPSEAIAAPTTSVARKRIERD